MSGMLPIFLVIFVYPILDVAVPAFVNPYDPKLGGINCNEDCSIMANGRRWTDDDYGRLAACNPEYMGCRVTFTNDYGQLGPLLCTDTGGALLEPVYSEQLDQMVQFFDVLWPLTDGQGEMIDVDQLPWWNYAVFDDWQVDCSLKFR